MARPAIPELRRSSELKFKVQPGQLSDLRLIAQGWGVPLTVTCYAIIAEFISRARHEALKFGSDPVYKQLVASARLLAAMEVSNDDEER